MKISLLIFILFRAICGSYRRYEAIMCASELAATPLNSTTFTTDGLQAWSSPEGGSPPVPYSDRFSCRPLPCHMQPPPLAAQSHGQPPGRLHVIEVTTSEEVTNTVSPSLSNTSRGTQHVRVDMWYSIPFAQYTSIILDKSTCFRHNSH